MKSYKHFGKSALYITNLGNHGIWFITGIIDGELCYYGYNINYKTSFSKSYKNEFIETFNLKEEFVTQFDLFKGDIV